MAVSVAGCIRRRPSLATLLVSMCLSAAPAHAQSTDWTDGTGSWFVGSNWSNGVPSTIASQVNVANGGTAQINGGVAVAGVGSTISIANAGSAVDVQTGGSLFTGTINVNSGGTLLLSGSTAVSTANGIILGGGTLLSTVTGSISNNIRLAPNTTSTIAAAAGQTLTLSGPVFNLAINNPHVVFGSAVDTGTVVVAASILSFGNFQATIDVAGGTLQAGNASLGSITFITPTTVHAGATLDFNDQAGSLLGDLHGAGRVLMGINPATTLSIFKGDFSGQISGAGHLFVTAFSASDTLTLSGPNDYTGGTTISSGTLRLAGAGTLGSIANSITISENTTILNLAGFAIPSILDLGATTQIQNGGVTLIAGTIQNGALSSSGTFDVRSGTVSAVLAGSGTLIKSTTDGVTLSGSNTYSGATTVNGGTLSVNGSIALSSMTTVNSGGVLSGTGIVGNTTINGGIFTPGSGAPGSAMTVAGSLAFQSGALYLLQLNPAASTFANVTGTASLNGSVGAVFLPGNYLAKQYTILSAAGGINGTFASLVNTNLPSTFAASLSYDANNAYLNLGLALTRLPGLTGNQQSVANALTNYFNSNGGIPIVFGLLTPAGLAQISGETATGSQQTTFDAMTQFLGVLLDPFIGGRGDSTASTANATPFTEEGDAANAYASTGRKRTGAERDAYGMITKAVPRNNLFDPRWSIWAAGFGGSQTTDGNAALGSNNTSSRVFGTAVGADYIFSPRTIAGFALAGGGTNFSIANAGSGRSDLFQAGAFIRHTAGAAYVSGALAYGWQDITTDRTVTVAGVDQLRARFNANAFSGRVEGGYRFATPWMSMGITPYAAGQFTTFDLPAYAEQVLSGANTFALAYNSKSVTDTRSEIGIRTDKSWALQNAVLTLRGRFAWAHDFNPDRGIGATFQTLPGASFVVNGAAQSRDSALTTASAEMKWRNGVSLAAAFEGEFSDVTRSYAGKGVVRYAW
jgi:autotransporter-associated beta strand protein